MTRSLRRILALVLAELRAMVRDPVTNGSLLLVALVIGLAGPGLLWLQDRLQEEERADQAEREEPEAAWACEPGFMQPVAVAGQVPSWLRWPDPLQPADEAMVMLSFLPPEPPDPVPVVEVIELEEEARPRAVRRCLFARIRAERRARLQELGITEEPFAAVRVDQAVSGGAAPDGPALPTPGLGASLASSLAVVLLSVFMELGPRSRASGWLEAWLSLPGRRGDLVLAWSLVGLLAGAGAVLLTVLGDALGSALLGFSTAAPSWLAVPLLAVVMTALGVRAFLTSQDQRAALASMVPVLLGVMGAVGIALLVSRTWPGWAGWVPLGGLALVLAGELPLDAAPVLSSLLLAGALLWSATRELEGIAIAEGATSRAAARRARGDYLPEALLLVLLGLAGTSAWAPPEMLLADLRLRTAFALVAFLLLPALLVSLPLGLDRRELLSLRPPPARSWLLLPLVVLGSMSMAGLLWELAVDLQGPSATTRAYAEAIRGFQSPLGLLIISVFPGICEELLFRGAVLGLLRRGLPDWAALVLQAAGFAALHVLAVRLPYTFAMGLLLGLLVLRTGSLWPAIVVHTVHNLATSLLPPERAEAWLDTPLPWVLAVLGLVATWATGARRVR